MPQVMTPQPRAIQHHTVTYRILNSQWESPVREIDVWASPEEIRSLVEDGYLVRPALIQGEHLQRLRDALDRVAEQELAEQRARFSSSRAFGGLFLRFLEDKDPAFFDLIKFAPTLS